MRDFESWLNLLAVHLPMSILNHNGEGHCHLGIVWHGWFSIHGTGPDARRVERCPFTRGNRPLGAAADHQYEWQESPYPTVSKPIRRDEVLNRGATVLAYRGGHRDLAGWRIVGGLRSKEQGSAVPAPSTRRSIEIRQKADPFLNPRMRTPAPTRKIPTHSRTDGRSLTKRNAKTATIKRLSLSTGATFDASPILRARK